jgi:hypothetical protein
VCKDIRSNQRGVDELSQDNQNEALVGHSDSDSSNSYSYVNREDRNKSIALVKQEQIKEIGRVEGVNVKELQS